MLKMIVEKLNFIFNVPKAKICDNFLIWAQPGLGIEILLKEIEWENNQKRYLPCLRRMNIHLAL